MFQGGKICMNDSLLSNRFVKIIEKFSDTSSPSTHGKMISISSPLTYFPLQQNQIDYYSSYLLLSIYY